MAAYVNRVLLAGNVTHDPELRYIPSGTAVTDLRMAINERRKTASGDWVDEPVFVDVTLWARQAEVACEYLSKGSSVLIEGRLKFDSWETPDGQKRSKLRVVGERMQMLGGKGEGGGRGDGGSRGEGGGRSDAGRGGPPQRDESEYRGGYDDDPGGMPAGRRGGTSAAPPDDDVPF